MPKRAFKDIDTGETVSKGKTAKNQAELYVDDQPRRKDVAQNFHPTAKEFKRGHGFARESSNYKKLELVSKHSEQVEDPDEPNPSTARTVVSELYFPQTEEQKPISMEAVHLSEEDRSYFRAIKEDVDKCIAGKDSGEEYDVDLMEAIWDRIHGYELLIYKDKELSFMIEALLRLTGSRGVVRALSAFFKQTRGKPETISELCSHASGSRVVESIIDAIAVFHSDDEELRKEFHKKLRRFIRTLLQQPEVFFSNNYAVHILEKLLLRLCKIISWNVANGSMIYQVFDITTNSADTVGFAKDLLSYQKLSDKLSELGKSIDVALLDSVLTAVENQILDGEKIEKLSEKLLEICFTQCGSIIIQAVIIALPFMERNSSSSSQFIIPQENSSAPSQQSRLSQLLMESFDKLLFDKYGSRVAETLITTCSPDLFESLLLQAFGNDKLLENILRDRCAHHGLIKLIQFATEVPQMVTIGETLMEKISLILESGHGMILVKFAEKLGDEEAKRSACGRHGGTAEWHQCQTNLLEQLKTYFENSAPKEWSNDQKTSGLVILIGAFYARNFRSDILETSKSICMAGSQILQACCSFKDSSMVANGLLKLKPEILLEICCNPSGSYLIETAIEKLQNRKGFSAPFTKKLADVVDKLVMNKTGSRVFDYLWKKVDLKNRELLTEKLSPVESSMKSNEFARYLLPKLNLGLYRRNPEAWRKEQKTFQNQKDELKAFLDVLQKS